MAAKNSGRDELKGGAGIDEVDYTTKGRSVTVTLDGKANDGAAGGVARL